MIGTFSKINRSVNGLFLCFLGYVFVNIGKKYFIFQIILGYSYISFNPNLKFFIPHWILKYLPI